MSASNKENSQNNDKFILVWLDGLVQLSPDNIDTTALLKRFVNRLVTFDKKERCAQYIQSLPDETFVMIVSGRLGQEIMPYIKSLPQLKAVYVYCSDKKRNDEWAVEFSKVKGVIVNIKDLIRQIKCEQIQRKEYELNECLPITYYYKKARLKPTSVANNDDFICFQLLLNCLSRMNFDIDTLNLFAALCKEEYKDNEEIKRDLIFFEENYSADRSIWWYTKEPLIRKALKTALEPNNVNLLFYSHFIFYDIRQELEDKAIKKEVRTYRSLLMTNQEVKLLRQSIGDWFSINTFFLTITNRTQALEMFDTTVSSTDLKRVLFEIECHPEVDYMTVYGDVSSLNYSSHKNLILFTAGTIFHPVDICEENGITFIQMELCSNSDAEMKSVFENMKSEGYDQMQDVASLGGILMRMKRFEDAETYYNQLLKIVPNDQLMVSMCYQGLGKVALERKDYDSSINLFEKAISIDQKILKPEDPRLATSYTNIAEIYLANSLLSQAHEYYLKALKILIVTLGNEHPKVVLCYRKIAGILEMQQKYSEALIYYEKVSIIYEKNSSTLFSDKAQLHNQIAHTYASIDKSAQALVHYKTAAKLFREIYPQNHPDLIKALKNISYTYETLGNLQKAVEYLEKLHTIHMKLLPANDPEIVAVVEDIRRLSSQLH